MCSIAATNKIELFSSGYFPVAIKIHRPFFKFDSIKNILEAWFMIQLFLWQLKVYIC
jgi:hypothetical protein